MVTLENQTYLGKKSKKFKPLGDGEKFEKDLSWFGDGERPQKNSLGTEKGLKKT